MKIGFFDSGLGGLTILKAVTKELPQYDYVFYGDTENLPYGEKNEDVIYQLTIAGIEYLFKAGCTIVVTACNTASAETLKKIQNEYLPMHHPSKKVLGIIIPTIEVLEFATPTKVALLATKRTVESGKYSRELNLRENVNVILSEIATPELVPLIELGELGAATTAAIKRIETEAGKSAVIVLGCTHYTQIKDSLRKHYKDKKIILSQDEIIPKKLREYLSRHPELETQLGQKGERNIHLTKHRVDYDLILGQFLGGTYLGE